MLIRVFIVALLATSAYGHYLGKVPEPRTGSSASTNSPCGGRAVGQSTVTSLQPNSWVNITWRILQSHSKQTTISLSDGATDTFSCVLLARVPHLANAGGKEAMVSVYIPNVLCDNCAIQIANDNWYTCSQVKISGTVPRNQLTCHQPCSWPYYNYTSNQGTADPRWQKIPSNAAGRELYFLDVYGKPAAFAASANQPRYNGPACAAEATVAGAVGRTTRKGSLNTLGTNHAVAARLALTGTTAIAIVSGTRSGTTVQLTIEGPSDRWFGIGFGTQMVTSDALIWSSGTGSSSANDLRLEDYYLTGKTPALVLKDAVQDWTLVSRATVGAKTTLVAQRAVITGDAQDTVLSGAATPIIWAMGTTANNYMLNQHGNAATSRAATATTLTWQTVTAPPGGTPVTGNGTTATPTQPGNGTIPSGGAAGAASQDLLVAKGFGVYGARMGSSSPSTGAHGFFMGVSWAILIPVAVVINRYRDQFEFLHGEIRGEKTWFQLHRGLNMTAFLFMFIALCVKWGELGMITSSFHAVLGMMLIFLTLFSIIAGFCRPDETSERRELWLKIHRYAGFIYLFWAFIQMCIGLSIGGATLGSILTFVLWIVILIAGVAFLEWRKMNGVSKGNVGNTKSSIDMHARNPPPPSGQAIVAVDEGEAPTSSNYVAPNPGPPPPVPGGSSFPAPPVPGGYGRPKPPPPRPR